MEKKFKFGGVSCGKDGYKVRFANDMTRVKILGKTDTDVNLVDLPQEMTKPELVVYLKTTELYQKPEYREAIDNADARLNPVVKARATKSAAKVKPNLDSIKARAKESAAEAAE